MMKKLLLVSAGLVVVGSALAWSSWGEMEHKEAHGSDIHAKKMASKCVHVFAQVGNELVCPVMGTKFRVNKKTVYSRHEGKCYAFCCPGCKAPFEKTPEKYVSKEVKPKEHKQDKDRDEHKGQKEHQGSEGHGDHR